VAILSNGKARRISTGDQRLDTISTRDDECDPFGRKRNGDAPQTRSTYLGDVTGGTSAYRWTMGLGGEPDLSKPYFQHPWVYACVSALSRAASSVPARLDRRLASGEYEQDVSAALSVSLGMPNPLQSQRKFFRSICTSQMLYGETFIILLKRDEEGRMVPVRSVGGSGMMAKIEQPEEFWPVRGDLADAIIDPKTKLPSAWRFSTGGGYVDYPAYSIVQIAEVNPYSPAGLRGAGPMQAAYRTASKDFIIDRYDEALLTNGGSPGGVLSVDGPLTDADQRAIREAWQEAHGRPESHRKTAVLPQGTEYKEIGMSPQAMEHEKLREWDRQTILSIFGVPPVVLGLETINYATAREQNRIFWETSVLPYLDFLKDELQHKLVNRINSPDAELRLDFDITGVSALREDMTAKVDRALKIYTEGNRSFNESARLSGWDITEEELVGGDERWVPSSQIPAEVGAQQTLDTATAPPREAPEQERDLAEVGREVEEELPESGIEWPSVIDTEEKRDAYWKTYTEQEEEVIEVVHKRTYRVYRDLLLSVRKTLKAIAGKKDVSSQIETKAFTDAELERLLKINVQEWGALLAQEIAPQLKLSQVAAAGGVAAEIGARATITSVTDPFIVEFYKDYPVYLAEGATTTLARDVKKAILKALLDEDLGTVSSLSEAIRVALEPTLSSVDQTIRKLNARAARIARTETIKANNGARVQEMRLDGVKRHTWLSSRDSGVRDAHKPGVGLDGVTVKVGEPFAPGLRFPGDGRAAAAQVVNCRCTTVPVLKE